MRKELFAAAAVIVAPLGSVLAEETRGAIPVGEAGPRQVMLEGGTIDVVSENAIETLRPGREVLVVFEENASGEKEATHILILR